MITISLWYDINKKIYASDKKSDWIKTYTDEKCEQTKDEISADMAELETYVNSTAETLAEDISEINESLSSEVSARQTLAAQTLTDVTSLDSKITTESTARATADTALGGRITSEASARESADTALGGRITSETSARESADTALGGRITSETSARESADTTLSSRITAITGSKGQANGYAPLDENGKLSDSYLYGSTVKKYGIRINGTSTTTCERLGDAVGLTAQAQKGDTQSYYSDFDNIYPWSDMRLCNVDGSGNITAYVGEPNFKRDGSNGDVMVEIPKFYYKRTKSGTTEEWWICEIKLPGYELHPLFVDDGAEVNRVFHSAYNANTATNNGTTYLQSKAGIIPTAYTTMADFRTYARAKGSGWGIEDIACISALQMLFTIEFADLNSQNVLGNGIPSRGNAEAETISTAPAGSFVISYDKRNAFNVGTRILIGTEYGTPDIASSPRTVTAQVLNSEEGTCTVTFDGPPVSTISGNYVWEVFCNNGSCDSLAGKSGSFTSNYYKDVCYRGIEGFFGKHMRFIDGVNIKDHVYYVANSMNDYANATYSGKYSMLGIEDPETAGYITEIGYDSYNPWALIPCVTGGSSSTYYCDYYRCSVGPRNLRYCQWYSSEMSGIFCFYCDGGLNARTMDSGVHLIFKK